MGIFGIWARILILSAAWIFLTTSAFGQSSSYRLLLDGLGQSGAPGVVVSDKAGGAIIAGVIIGEFYIRRVNADGNELWFYRGAHPYYPVTPEKLVVTNDNAVIVQGEYRRVGDYNHQTYVARFSLSDGLLLWETTRTTSYYENSAQVFFDSFNGITFLCSKKRINENSHVVAVEGIAPDGFPIWSYTTPVSDRWNHVCATLDPSGRFVVAVRPTSNINEITIFSHDILGARTTVASLTFPIRVRGVYSIIHDAVGSLYLSYWTNDGFLMKLTDGNATWTSRTAFVFDDFSPIDGSDLCGWRQGGDGMRFMRVNKTTGAIEARSGPFWSFSPFGLSRQGHYMGFFEGAIRALDRNFILSRSTVVAPPTPYALGCVTSGERLIFAGISNVDGRNRQSSFVYTSSGTPLYEDFHSYTGSSSFVSGLFVKHDGSVITLERHDRAYLREIDSSGQPGFGVALPWYRDETKLSDGGFLTSRPVDGFFTIDRIDALGNLQYSVPQHSNVSDFVQGADGSAFFTRIPRQQYLVKCDARGRDVWATSKFGSIRDSVGDAEGGIVFYTYAPSRTLRLFADGRIRWEKPGNVQFVQDPNDWSYYIVRSDEYAQQTTIDRFSKSDRVVWSKHLDGSRGKAVVDLNGNLIIVSAQYELASFDKSGRLRWLRDIPLRYVYRLIVTKQNEIAALSRLENRLEEAEVDGIACAIIPNSSSGSIRYEEWTAPNHTNANNLESDFAGNVFVTGFAERYNRQGLVWRLGSDARLFSASSFNLVAGEVFDSRFGDTANSNDRKLQILADAQQNRVELSISAIAPSPGLGRLSVRLEHGGSHPGLVFQAYIKNHSTGAWTEFGGSRNRAVETEAFFFTESNEYVHPTTRKVEIRAVWRSPSPFESSDGWTATLDHVGFSLK